VIEVVDVVDSVKSAVKWLNNHGLPELIFMDIQLGDGLSFEIFERTTIQSPIIFTTAYDEYAIKAFKVNSIDYLLKPIDESDLKGALDKFESMKLTSATPQSVLERIGTAVQMLTKRYKERFVTKVGEHLKFIDVSDIQYFMSEDKITFCKTKDARNHILDFTMDEIEQLVDPAKFFRINRKYIVSVEAILDMISHTNSRLKIVLRSSDDHDVIVARERVQEFKAWLDR
jgi:DNA-binding LytR/AlgR family response regulator